MSDGGGALVRFNDGRGVALGAILHVMTGAAFAPIVAFEHGSLDLGRGTYHARTNERRDGLHAEPLDTLGEPAGFLATLGDTPDDDAPQSLAFEHAILSLSGRDARIVRRVWRTYLALREPA